VICEPKSVVNFSGITPTEANIGIRVVVAVAVDVPELM
jgi:hypothetical protein